MAFTGKHQWIFGDSDTDALGTAGGNAVNSRCMLEKVSKQLLSVDANILGNSYETLFLQYPSGWEAQFAAGIKVS